MCKRRQASHRARRQISAGRVEEQDRRAIGFQDRLEPIEHAIERPARSVQPINSRLVASRAFDGQSRCTLRG